MLISTRMIDCSVPDHWATVRPEEVAPYFLAASVPWWIAGGWALDLFLGRQTREHRDLDVAVLRHDCARLLAALRGWEIFEARNGVLSRLPAASAPRDEVNSLWCRPAGATSWALEILLDAGGGSLWLFRRQPEIQRPLTEIIRRTTRGLPHLAPEIQLLYKARTPRPQDQDDFARVAPQLDAPAKKWLRESLHSMQATHPWLDFLEAQSRN